MKKFILAAILIIITALSWYKINKNQAIQAQYKGFASKDFVVEGRNHHFLLADTPQKWERGLMYFRDLPGYDGMIFVFPDKQPREFWNKNTYMDLHLYWIDGTKVVNRSFLPSIEKSKQITTVESIKPVNIVVEMPTNK